MVKLEELKLFENVPKGSEFRLYRGGSVQSVLELYGILQKMAPEVFYFHVTAEKNDFASWIRGVHKDYRLADALRPSMRLAECLDVISRRLYELRKATDDVDKKFHKRMIAGVQQKDRKSAPVGIDNLVQDISPHKVEKAEVPEPPQKTAPLLLTTTVDSAPAAKGPVKKKSRLKDLKMKDIFDHKEFASDMKKVFTVQTRKRHTKTRIDVLRKVYDYDKQ